MVRAEGVDPPPFTVSLTVKRPFFYDFPGLSRQKCKGKIIRDYLWLLQVFQTSSSNSYLGFCLAWFQFLVTKHNESINESIKQHANILKTFFISAEKHEYLWIFP